MRKVLYSVLIAVLVMVIAVPVFAGGLAPVGEQIVDSYHEFEEGEPFHVIHGWGVPLNVQAIGVFAFVLEIDGAVQHGPIVVDNFKNVDGEPAQTRLWLHNFPDGLPPGDYVFTKRWFAPCYQFSTTCDTPNEPTEVFTLVADVSVVP